MSLRRSDLTYRDYLDLPEGLTYEILDGELFQMTPAPSPDHQRISRWIQLPLTRFIEEHRMGEVFNAPIDVIFSETNVLQPDLLWIQTNRLSIVKEKGIFGAPDLVVEILSPTSTRRDGEIKFKIYEAFGVKEFWLVSPQGCWLDVYAQSNGHYQLVQRFGGTDTLRSALLPGFELPLTQVFRTAP